MRIALSNKQILEHLEMIDSHLHMPYSEFILPPSIVSLNEIARLMVQHVGLYGYEPVIEYDRLEAGVAGHVELNNNLDKQIHITLSDDMSIAREARLSALAHEICHKLLFTHNCYFPFMGDYNESLTDIATIYVGFGKLTLNGCLVVYNKSNRVFDLTTSNPSLQTSHITSYTGYLSLEQYAMAYRLVCHVNHIPQVDYEAGLDAEALPVMQSNNRIEALESQLAELPELLRQYRIRKYEKDAAMMRDVMMMEAALKQIKEELTSRQKADIESLGIVDSKNGEIINPYRVMLRAIDTGNEAGDATKDIPSVSQRMKQLMQENSIQNATLNITCPVCGFTKEKAVAEHKTSLIRCPKCSRVFYWDSSIPAKDARSEKNNNSFFNIFKWIKKFKKNKK